MGLFSIFGLNFTLCMSLCWDKWCNVKQHCSKYDSFFIVLHFQVKFLLVSKILTDQSVPVWARATDAGRLGSDHSRITPKTWKTVFTVCPVSSLVLGKDGCKGKLHSAVLPVACHQCNIHCENNPWRRVDRDVRPAGRNEGAKGGTILRAPKSPNNVTSTFFNTVHSLPKDLRFEHGGAKLASCPGAISPDRYAPGARRPLVTLHSEYNETFSLCRILFLFLYTHTEHSRVG